MSEWRSLRFQAHLWLLRHFGRRMGCGCRGYCLGHLGRWSSFKIVRYGSDTEKADEEAR